MAATLKNISTKGERICKDGKNWIVKVPTVGGYGIFSPEDYRGSSAKALQAARAFCAKMERQLKQDREYFAKHGEKIARNALHIRNRTGYAGVAKQVYPNLESKPLIVYIASWPTKSGKRGSAWFSTAQYPTEKEALAAAVQKRAEMMEFYNK